MNKKGKGAWEGDAFVLHNSKVVTLISDKGKMFVTVFIQLFPFSLFCSAGTSAWKGTPLQSGDILYFGSKEVQLVQTIKSSDLPMDTGEADPPEDDVIIVDDTPDAPVAKKFATPVTTNGVTPASFYGSVKKPVGPLYASFSRQRMNASHMSASDTTQTKREQSS